MSDDLYLETIIEQAKKNRGIRGVSTHTRKIHLKTK